eukprot:scaffold17922_cov129-Skeletonema_dohrnii-CCMP3373.AAC.3
MENTNKECGSCGRRSDDLKICTGVGIFTTAAETVKSHTDRRTNRNATSSRKNLPPNESSMI